MYRLTSKDGCRIVPGVMRADTKTRELVLHPEEGHLVLLSWGSSGHLRGRCTSWLCQGKAGVGPAHGLVAVGPTHQQVFRVRLGQHPDVVLALVLKLFQKEVIIHTSNRISVVGF